MHDLLDENYRDLLSADLGALRELWSSRFDAPWPRTNSLEFLRCLIAWKDQAEEVGELSAKSQRRLASLARSFKHNPDRQLSGTPRFGPGTVISRSWKGKRHDVQVLESGYAYLDVHYESLSAIAREITGTRWNGPAFFGLRKSQ